jgi:hypothetical protein
MISLSDRREEILFRIEQILASIADANTVIRNVDEIPESSRPCLILIDGDEAISPTSTGRNGQPLIMEMTPVIAIGVSDRPETLGAQANGFRAAILAALLGDTQLQTIIGAPNGRIQYTGAKGKLSHGSLMASDLQLDFTISYKLDPAELP